MTSQPAIAFLGLGRMGLPMAMNLVRAGFRVRVWNRTPSRTRGFAVLGGVPAATPADATRGADIVITMLADGQAVGAAMQRPEGGLEGAEPGQVWVQMSTVGVQWTRQLSGLAAAYKISYVDAPVSGSEGPARTGDLVILASGPADVHDKLAPVFAALGRATVWLGEAGAGSRAKLVLNNMLVDLVEATAEALTAFALKHAVKDAGLAVDAAHDSDMRLALTEALLPRWRRTASAGHADEDLAAV